MKKVHAYKLLYDVQTQSSGMAILYPGMESFGSVLHYLFGAGEAVLLGGVVMYFGLKFGWFHIHLPEYATFELYFTKILRLFVEFCKKPVSFISGIIDTIVIGIMVNIWLPALTPGSLTGSLISKMEQALKRNRRSE